MKKYLLFFFLVSFSGAIYAQLLVNAGVTPTQLVNGFIGPGLSVSNISLNCAAGAYGTFSNGNTTNLGIINGSIFTSGAAAGAIGPDNTPSYSVSNGTFASDPDLATIEPLATNDPCILTFNVIPSCGTLTIRFVFGSEEYPEWVSSGYNDAFGFFITGPNPSGPAYSGYNVARLPNGIPVSIDNVNAGANAAYYVNNGGGTTIQYDGMTTVIISNLSVVPCGTYFFKVAIADAGDYIYDSGVFIDLLSCSTAITTTSSSTPTCGCTGTATVFPSGGNPAYTYVWNTSPVQNTQTAVGLCPGIYVCTVYDQSGCASQSNSTSVTVGSQAGPNVSASSTPTGCTVANGTATANPSGGTAPYTYLWNTSPPQNTQTANNLGAGTYMVTVTDANGCTAQVSVVVSGTNAPTVNATSTQTGCTVANGSATANPSGGTAPYTYLWSNGDPNQTANNLAAGTYTVVVTDANGCSAFTTVTITTMNGPTTSSVITNVTCNGLTNGSATTNPTGGTPGYTYSWSPSGGNGQTANNLGAGNYVVTITDANGCTVTDTITITEPPAITLTTSQNNILCFGGTNGDATATASGGNPGYNYSWNTSPVQNTQTATGLSAGTYQCTVTDASGCTNVVSVTITQLPALTASLATANVQCFGMNNGNATATVTNGTAPYTYLWNTTPPQNTQTINGLSPGTYIVTITDANGCSTQSSVTITEPPLVSLSITCGDSICAGGSALLIALPSGGTPAYTYFWTPVSQSSDSIYVSPTSNSSYTVSVADANGCTSAAQACTVIILPSAIALFDTTSSGTFGSTYLFSDLSSGGTSWTWNFGDGSNGSTLSDPVHTFPGAGTYTVTQVVFNQYGCPDTFRITVIVEEGILIPNVFTPDGDGVNDVWYIPNSGMKEFHADIYDRWGLKVFETTADEIRWDGRSSSGKRLHDGTYYFVLKAFLKSGAGEKDYSTKGYVTLLTKKK